MSGCRQTVGRQVGNCGELTTRPGPAEVPLVAFGRRVARTPATGVGTRANTFGILVFGYAALGRIPESGKSN